MVKKYLIFSFVVVLFTQNNFTQTQKIEENTVAKHLSLDIRLSQDTVFFDQEITIAIIFENKTDTCISFDPKALLVLAIYYEPSDEKQLIGYRECTAHFLSYPQNDSASILLKPYNSHHEAYTVTIDSCLFKRGSNRLFIGYSCHNTGISKQYNKLYGWIDSSPFEVYVK